MKKIVPLLLLVCLLSGFRSFPSLSEPDPTVVFAEFQSHLTNASGLEDFARYISSRKKREYQRKLAAADASPGGGDRMLDGLRQNFYLMKPELVQQEINPDSAILVYRGAVNLNGLDYVPVTMGVLMVKEDGAWKVDRDKITYKITREGDGFERQESGRMAF